MEEEVRKHDRREVPTHDVFDVCGGGGKGLGAHGGVVVFSGVSVAGAQPWADVTAGFGMALKFSPPADESLNRS